jgi:hypothetical protein
MSATACLTSSNLKGLIIAVINFMHLSPLAPVCRNRLQKARQRTIEQVIAASVPGLEGSRINGLVEKV